MKCIYNSVPCCTLVHVCTQAQRSTAQDPGSFSGSQSLRLGDADALPATQLLLVDSPEPSRLLITLAACPQAPLVPPDAASRNPTQATSQGAAAKCAPDPAAGAAHGARAAAGVARNMAGPSSALDVERFDWRTAPPALLALAAWDAGGDAGAAGGGRVTVGSAAGGPAAAGLGTREHDGVCVDPGDEDVQEPRATHGMPAESSQGPGTPLASCAEGSAGGSGAAEVAAGHGTESGAVRDGPKESGSLATMPQHTRWEPTPKQQGPPEAAEAFGAPVQGAPTQAAGHERAPLLRLATGTCTGALLDLPRGRHLLRPAAGCGRLSVVGVHSSTPFHAGDATQVEPTSRPVPIHPCDSSLTRLMLSQMRVRVHAAGSAACAAVACTHAQRMNTPADDGPCSRLTC